MMREPKKKNHTVAVGGGKSHSVTYFGLQFHPLFTGKSIFSILVSLRNNLPYTHFPAFFLSFPIPWGTESGPVWWANVEGVTKLAWFSNTFALCLANAPYLFREWRGSYSFPYTIFSWSGCHVRPMFLRSLASSGQLAGLLDSHLS